MTLTTIAALFSAMVALAVIPDASTMAVAARSISSGFKQGVVVIAGIITGDFVFILFAVFGLAALAESMDHLFHLVTYLGAAFLVFMAVMLFKDKPESMELESAGESSTKANFLCGLFITLGDPKAILFYLSFLPAFADLSDFQIMDITIVLMTVVVALCCTKLVYAFMADRARVLFKSIKAKRILNRIAASVMLLTACTLVIQL